MAPRSKTSTGGVRCGMALIMASLFSRSASLNTAPQVFRVFVSSWRSPSFGDFRFTVHEIRGIFFAGDGYVTTKDGTSRSESFSVWLASVGGFAFSPQPLLRTIPSVSRAWVVGSARNDFAVRAAVAHARDTARACHLACAIGHDRRAPHLDSGSRATSRSRSRQ